MNDDLAGLSDVSSDEPADDIESRLAALEAKYEDRIKGFQRLLAGRDAEKDALQAKLEEIQSAGMPDDERLALREKKLLEENERLKTQLEFKDLASEYGEEFPIFEKLLNAPSAKDQLEALRELRAAAKAAETPKPSSSGVDMNNPRRSAPLPSTADGMTDDLADRILGSVRRIGDLRP